MTRQQLVEHIHLMKSFLCVGLDPDMGKLPKHLLNEPDPIFAFNKAIIDATHVYCVSYKPNSAFYEAHGVKGFESLVKTIDYIKMNYPNHFIIADAKRGDIGNTSGMYAKAFFSEMKADAITVAPYMGSDSVKPFLTHKNKWVILLGLTSNEGAFDFQTKELSGKKKVFEQVLETSKEWGNEENMMYVIGATKAELLADVRKIIPNHFLLIPGVGAQGGNLEEVCKYGLTKDIGLLINSSRQIIYASNGNDFAEKAAEEAAKVQKEMEKYFI
ncbi:MAG TPA: orotidine-5'-phosphate decarboxylase [Bacteroidia bacterium]|jgi:orotidine-5'-phosphate decarboxylase|nr:orotidine-5'-phosphate decarboxylase [Bacteroidia bacterium]